MTFPISSLENILSLEADDGTKLKLLKHVAGVAVVPKDWTSNQERTTLRTLSSLKPKDVDAVMDVVRAVEDPLATLLGL